MSKATVEQRAYEAAAEALVQAIMGCRKSAERVREVNRLAGRAGTSDKVWERADQILCGMLASLPGITGTPLLYTMEEQAPPNRRVMGMSRGRSHEPPHMAAIPTPRSRAVHLRLCCPVAPLQALPDQRLPVERQTEAPHAKNPAMERQEKRSWIPEGAQAMTQKRKGPLCSENGILGYTNEEIEAMTQNNPTPLASLTLRVIGLDLGRDI